MKCVSEKLRRDLAWRLESKMPNTKDTRLKVRPLDAGTGNYLGQRKHSTAWSFTIPVACMKA